MAAALQMQLEQNSSVPNLALKVRSALGVAEDEDIPDIVLAWRVETSEDVCVAWIVTDGGFVYLDLGANGVEYAACIPTWRIRQVVERVADGEVTVAIEVDADDQTVAGAWVPGDTNSHAGQFEARVRSHQFRASEQLRDDSSSPLQLLARAARSLLMNG